MQARPRLVEVAPEHLAVRAEVRVVRVAGRDRLAPRRREARDDRAGERLVLGRLDHVRAQVVLVAERVGGLAVEALELVGRLVQRVVVLLPALLVRRRASCRTSCRASPRPRRPLRPATRRSRARASRRRLPSTRTRACWTTLPFAASVCVESMSSSVAPTSAARARPQAARRAPRTRAARSRGSRRSSPCSVSYETSTGCPVESSTVAESAPPFPVPPPPFPFTVAS